MFSLDKKCTKQDCTYPFREEQMIQLRYTNENEEDHHNKLNFYNKKKYDNPSSSLYVYGCCMCNKRMLQAFFYWELQKDMCDGIYGPKNK